MSISGTGTYLVAPGGAISGALPTIPPGIYRGQGAAGSANYAIYSHVTFLDAAPSTYFGEYGTGVATGGIDQIVIPPFAYGFATEGYGSWDYAGPCPNFYMKTRSGAWLDLIAPTKPNFPAEGHMAHGPQRLRIRMPGSEGTTSHEYGVWALQEPDGPNRLHLLMPDGNWLEVTRFRVDPELAVYNFPWHPVQIQGGGFGPYLADAGLRDISAFTSSTGWSIRSLIDGASPSSYPDLYTNPFYIPGEGPLEHADVPLSIHAEDLDGYVTVDSFHGYMTVDLELARWLNRVYNPHGRFTPRLRMTCFIGAATNGGPADFDAEALLYTASAPVEEVGVFPGHDLHGPNEGAVFPRLLNTAAGTAVSLIHTFTSSVTGDILDLPLDLSGGARCVSYYLQIVPPPYPGFNESRVVDGGVLWDMVFI